MQWRRGGGGGRCYYFSVNLGFSSFGVGEWVLSKLLVFHDIMKSYLVSIYLVILAISGITYGHLVTMATKACTYILL